MKIGTKGFSGMLIANLDSNFCLLLYEFAILKPEN